MKKALIILSLIIASCSSQKGVSNKKVSVLEISKDPTYSKPESVLFVFTGHTHFINYYKDLANTLKDDLKKEKIIASFNYNLSAKKSFQVDLDNTPKKKYNYTDYETLCLISINFPFVSKKGFSSKNIYELSFVLKESKKLSIKLKGKLRLKHGRTILTPTKEASKKLVNLIIE